MEFLTWTLTMDEEQDEVKSLSHSKDFGGVSSAVSLSVKEVPVKPTKVEMLPVPDIKVKEEPASVKGPCCSPPVAKKPKVVSNTIKVKAIRRFCAHCESKINTKYVLQALDKFWHEDCLKCSCCSRQLAELSSTFYYKENMLLCREDYIRLYGTSGVCSFCNKPIPPLEMVMRARGNVFHLECFACRMCHHRFCIGDRFYLYHNMVMCEDDYRDLMMSQPHYPGYSAQ